MEQPKPVKVITPDPLTVREYWGELKKYRSLIWVFAWQEIKTQYAQTYFGIAWAVLRPLIILSIFTVLFNYLLKIQTTSPYYLFAFSGMIAWNFFQQIAINASGAIAQRQSLIRKMYFPKLILPLSKVLTAGVETLVSLIIIFAMMLLEWFPVTWKFAMFPFFLLLNICCGLAVAFWMNALNIRYRDLSQIVMPLISIGIWFTPVFFPTTIIPQQYYFLMYLNPMAGIIEGFRFALLGEAFPNSWYFVSIGIMLFLFFTGAWYLTRVEDEIVDYG
ncbi:MAG: ABC transporter permease [Chitinophagales bacterium]|nr:ABC transporter permease [Chitinophagales bacterium]